MKASLSFLNEEDDEDEDKEEKEEREEFYEERKKNEPLKKKKIAKNPDVDTSHLPNRERDERLRKEKERLTQEWLAEQEIIKNQVSLFLCLSLHLCFVFLKLMNSCEDGRSCLQLLGWGRAQKSN